MNNLDPNEEFDLELKEPEEAPSDKPPRIIYKIAGILVIIGLIYISGINRLLFFQKTSETLEQPPIESALDADIVSVPLTVFILKNSNRGSERSPENVRNLVRNSSNIWKQANIKLNIEKTIVRETSNEELDIFYQDPRTFIKNLESYNYRAINVLLVGNLAGINGIAFGGARAVGIADYTSVYDFRALAHEVGHILGLSHTPEDDGRLMYQGANGAELTLEEILRAREFAKNF